MAQSGRLGRALDKLNEFYDLLRILACNLIDVAWTIVHKRLHEAYKRRMTMSITDETARRRPEYELELPPDSSLSFFDDYEIVNGSPVFVLDAVGTRSRPGGASTGSGRDPGSSSMTTVNRTVQLRCTTPKRILSFKLQNLKISCYTFSHDDHFIVCGMTDGSITIWDASTGSLVRTLRGPHEFAVADLAFSRQHPYQLISVDEDGYCVKWYLDANPLKCVQTHCAPSWDDSSYVGKELAVPRLSSDGRYVGFPVYTYVEPDIPGDEDRTPNALYSPTDYASNVPNLYSILFIFETDARTNDTTGRVDPLFVLPVKIVEPKVGVERLIDLILFSKTAKCLLLTVYELAKGYLVLWPRLDAGDVTSFKLDGTRGRFSSDERFLVTWHCMLASKDQVRDSSCYVWDLQKLAGTLTSEDRSGWNHPYNIAHEQMVLGDPNDGCVHSCDFIRLKNHVGLVCCCVSDEMTVIIWCLQTRTPLHVFRTDIPKEEMCPAFLHTMSGPSKLNERVPGVVCVSVSKSGKWVSVYGSASRRGIIWNASEGVEVLRIDVPEDKAETGSGMDICFSKTATKILFIGKKQMLLWSPSVLRKYNPADRPLYTLTAADPELDVGESICKFSADGSAVGLMRFNSERMTIWRFYPYQEIVLDRRQMSEATSRARALQGVDHFQVSPAKNRFCQFAASKDGLLIVSCMGDMSVLLWEIGDVLLCKHVATLTSYYWPALDVCFSADDNGRSMVVVCQDQGKLVWIDTRSEAIAYTTCTGATRSCKFSADGTTAVLMQNVHNIVVWDIVGRRQIRVLDYRVPILKDPKHGLSIQLAPNADFCLAGFDRACNPVLVNEETVMDELGPSLWYPETFTVSDNGDWALLSGRVDEDTDDLLLTEKALPTFGTQQTDENRFPELDFREEEITTANSTQRLHGYRQTHRTQTWRIVSLSGDGISKQMRLPQELQASRFVVLSLDGSKCAALNEENKLVVWGTHFTYKSIIQQRYEITHAPRIPNLEWMLAKLNENGPSLVNHPYEHGLSLVMECVATKNHHMLQQIIKWSLETGVKLSLQGRIEAGGPNNDEMITDNAIDLAVENRSPDIVETLLQAMIRGATQDSTLAQMLERSMIKLSYKYPALVLHLFKSRTLMKTLGMLDISEGYLRKRNDYMGVVTDERLVASEDYVKRLWLNAKQSVRHQPERFARTVQAEAKVIPYPNIAKMGREGILQPLLFERVQHFIFGSDLVKGVINFKYENHARVLLLEDLYHYLFLLFVFTCSCVYAGYKRSFGKTPGPYMTITLVIVVGLGNLVRLLKQLYSLWEERQYAGISYYMCDYMKWIELFSYLVVVFFVPVTMGLNPESDVLRGFMASASVLLWVKMLYYAQAFKSTGPMVVMIREIVKDIRWFLCLLLAFLLGFGVAFFVLLGEMSNDRFTKEEDAFVCEDFNATQSNGNNETCNASGGVNGTFEFADNGTGIFSGRVHLAASEETIFFRNPFASMLTVFLLMLSDISEILQTVFNAEGVSDVTKIVVFLLIVIFLASVAIVLLNLLIAIMGDSFDRVKNHEKTLYLQRRAEVIQDLEMGLSKRRKKEINDKIGRFLHILVPHFQSTLEESDWEGRLVDIQRRMREELLDARDRGTSDVLQLKRDLDEVKKLLYSLRASISVQGASGVLSDVDR